MFLGITGSKIKLQIGTHTKNKIAISWRNGVNFYVASMCIFEGSRHSFKISEVSAHLVM